MSGKKLKVLKWTSVAVLGVGALLLVRALPLVQLSELLQDWVQGLGYWGPVVFTLVYALATVCFLPGAVLTIAAGALFGLALGFAVASAASILGATAAFLIARYLARSRVESLAQSNDKFGAIDEAISEGGWKVVALLRLSPAVPFNLLNYLLGLTKIRLGSCVLASWIAMLPGTFLYVYVGHVAGQAAGSGEGNSTGQWVLLGIGMLATVVVTIYLTKLAQKKIDERVDSKAGMGNDMEASDVQGERLSPVKVFALAAAAALVLALGIVAQFNTEKIASVITSAGGPLE